MNISSPLELFKMAGAFAKSYMEVKQDDTRKSFHETFTQDHFFRYGSCVPIISNAIGTARIFYGVVLMSYGMCELVNKIAMSSFSAKTTFFEKAAVLKGGVLPILIKSCEHITVGFAAQNSLTGCLSSLFYELIIRPNLPEALVKEVSVDTTCFNKLMQRLKKHSLVKKIEASFKEFKSLLVTA